MQQLSALDAAFLHMESHRNYGHIGSVAIFDPVTESGRLTIDDVRAHVASRLDLLPPFRRRVVEVPFGLDHPYWIEDPDFDLDFHVRHIALPAPGDDRQLAEQVTRIAARHLDRHRPLWELYLIEGLEGGRVALQSKIHHAAIDGVSGAEVLATLLDLDPKPTELAEAESNWEPDEVPSGSDLLIRGAKGLAAQPLKLLAFQVNLAAELRRRGLSGLRENARVFGLPDPAGLPVLGWLFGAADEERPWNDVMSAPTMQAPRTSFNRAITPHRRWAFGSLPLEEVKAVKNKAGVTVNDVVMTLCGTALRRWLVDHGELPLEPLLAMVPVSVRTESQRGSLGNQVSAMIALLATNEEDPRRRLEMSHDAMRVAKEQHQAIPAALLQDFSEFAAPAVAARAARLLAGLRVVDRMLLPFNVIISNIPGPPFPLYFAGARMLATYPVSTISDGIGLNITVMSYEGHLDFGIIADRSLVPDVADLIGHLGEALEELTKAYARTKPARRANT